LAVARGDPSRHTLPPKDNPFLEIGEQRLLILEVSQSACHGKR
jgi:hypothetical protein